MPCVRPRGKPGWNPAPTTMTDPMPSALKAKPWHAPPLWEGTPACCASPVPDPPRWLNASGAATAVELPHQKRRSLPAAVPPGGQQLEDNRPPDALWGVAS